MRLRECSGLYMLGPGNGTIRRCGLVGVVWPHWRKCVTLGVGFETLLLAAWDSAFCLPLEQRVEVSAPPAPRLPAQCHASGHDDNGLNLRTSKSGPIKCFPVKEFPQQMVAAHTFNPSTWEAEAGGFLSSRPAWYTK